jgi:hypothetical protein
LTKSTHCFAKRSRNLLAVFCIALAGNLFFLSHARAEDVAPPEVTTIVTPGGDDVSYHIPLTVSVVYDGVTYENVYATTNSVITFGRPDGTYWTYPSTPSVSIESKDWWVLPQQMPDTHFIINVSEGGFQVDGNYRPYGTFTGDTTSIIITAQIQTDGTVAYSYAVDGPLSGNERTGAVLTDGTVVPLSEVNIIQVEEAPVLEPEPVAPEPEPVPVDPVPEPPVVDPQPEPTPEPVPQPEPEPVRPPVIEIPIFVPEPEPAPVEEEPVPEPEVEPEVEPLPTPSEPEPEPEPEPLEPEVPEEVLPVEPEPVDESHEEIITDESTPEEIAVAVEALIAAADGEAVTTEDMEEAGLTYEDLPPETPIEVRTDANGNEVIITAQVAAALEVLASPAEFIGAVFEDPAQALLALASIGADMSDEERKESTETVLAAVIVGQIATQSAVAAAGAAAAASSTYRRKP